MNVSQVTNIDLSETGRPILANDTHLVLSNPNVWYLNHLKSATQYLIRIQALKSTISK